MAGRAAALTALSSSWQRDPESLTSVALFNGGNGSHPTGIAIGSTGNLYGTTDSGGTAPSGTGSGYYGTASGYGTLFEVPAGNRTVTTLHTFDFGTNGEGPSYLGIDSAGDLYVTTLGPSPSTGTVFELAAGSSTLTTLHAFDGSDGQSPSGLVVDAAGNVYCSTESGGAQNLGTLVEVPALKTTVGAGLSTPQVTSATASETVTATFTDAAGINLASITPSGLTALDPGGSPLDVTGVSLSPDTGNPANLIATYTVAAPGGQWAAADNGTYTVTLNRGAVLDGADGTNAYTVASFTVNLPPPNADPDFAAGGNVNLGFTAVASAVQPDAKVLLAGFEPAAGGGTDAVLERLNADGSIDTAFGNGGTILDASTSNEAYDTVAVQSNGDIVVGGAGDGSLLVARYNADGSPDNSFGNGGRVTASRRHYGCHRLRSGAEPSQQQHRCCRQRRRAVPHGPLYLVWRGRFHFQFRRTVVARYRRGRRRVQPGRDPIRRRRGRRRCRCRQRGRRPNHRCWCSGHYLRRRRHGLADRIAGP